MVSKEDGVTLVEVLATLVLVTIVSMIIWTTVSIAVKFNVTETSTLHLQKEANYIIAELQQTHRHCYSYRLLITREKVEVAECENDEGSSIPKYNKVISNQYKYRLENSGSSPDVDRSYISPRDNLVLTDFVIIDPVNQRSGEEKLLKVPTTISRYITDIVEQDIMGEED